MDKDSLREFLEVKIQSHRDVLDERHRAERLALKIRRAYIEKRLGDLNGEAARIQHVLATTVNKGIFDSYVQSERERSDAAAKAQRDHFDAYAASQAMKQEEYHRTQTAAMKAYTDEMAKWRASVSVLMARWGGGLAVLLILLGVFMKFVPV